MFLCTAFAFAATGYWMFWIMNEPFSPWELMVFPALAFAAWLIVRGTRKAAPLVLAACVLFQSPAKADEEFKPQAALVVGGAIVTGIGVWVAYKIITRCRRIAASRTNLPPEELNFVVAGAQDEYAAGFFWPEEACYQERGLGTPEIEPVRCTMNISVTSASNCQSSLSFDVGSRFTQTLDECKEWAARKGIPIPSSPQFLECYARNGQPIAGESVPIKFDFATRTATVGQGGIVLMVEASDDLKTWSTLARLNVKAGSEIEIPDVSTQMQFYRVTTGGTP